MKSFQPDDEPEPPGRVHEVLPSRHRADPDVVAHAAADTTPVQAAQDARHRREDGRGPAQFAGQLRRGVSRGRQAASSPTAPRAPALSAWAAQSPQHAALVKPDAEALGKLEGWFSGIGDALHAGALDIAYAEAMRETRAAADSGSPRRPSTSKTRLRSTTAKSTAMRKQIARAVPQMAFYGAAVAHRSRGGWTSFMRRTKGVLARQIQLASPGPSVAGRRRRMGRQPHREEIDKYATIGSAAAAVTLAGLLGRSSARMPGVKSAPSGRGATCASRGAATTLGQAALRSLLGLRQSHSDGRAGHGAPARHQLRDDVQKAAGQGRGLDAARARGGGPSRRCCRSRRRSRPTVRRGTCWPSAAGSTHGAAGARAAGCAWSSWPSRCSSPRPRRSARWSCSALMGRGAKVFIDWKAAQKMKGLPPEDVAAAEAAQDSVEVPLERVPREHADQHEAVKDDVKLSADGATMNEARARDKELRGAAAGHGQGSPRAQTPDEVLGFEQPRPRHRGEPSPRRFNPGGARKRAPRRR
jgi:hypothetical protein